MSERVIHVDPLTMCKIGFQCCWSAINHVSSAHSFILMVPFDSDDLKGIVYIWVGKKADHKEAQIAEEIAYMMYKVHFLCYTVVCFNLILLHCYICNHFYTVTFFMLWAFVTSGPLLPSYWMTFVSLWAEWHCNICYITIFTYYFYLVIQWPLKHWHLLIFLFCYLVSLWPLIHCDICYTVIFVTLWLLSHCDIFTL